MTTTTHKPSSGRAPLKGEEVWREVAAASFAVLAYTTPAGEPRSCGVVCRAVGSRLYVVTSPDSWKARHLAAGGRVAVTVPVRRGGLLTLFLPIPPATISFPGAATLHAPGSEVAHTIAGKMGSMLPAERQASAAIIEIVPEGSFLTYGIGVPLAKLRDPSTALARVPVPRA
jgi:hypothetical protein